MLEEIKTDNNCIIKAFENNPIAILHEDINNKKVYYFKAADIGKALNLSNIAVSIQSYDEDEKVLRKAYDLRGCEQNTAFLTSGGVYRLLYNSKKEVAKKFRKWAGSILDDIIFNESAELKKQLKEKEEQLQLKENDLEAQKLLVKKKDKELKQMAKKISLDWLYVAVTDNVQGVSKIGITEEILKRIDGHLSSNPGFKYVYTYQSKNNKLIEKCIKALLDPFITNKNEWFNIESCDLIYLVEFFIELFDKNNGSEDPKLIIDFIKNISKKELPQEFICNELYDDFFETNMEIDSNGDKNYKCTLISIQKEFEKYLQEHEFNKQIRGNIKYLDVYTLDIKRYIKYKFNKTCERINIDDAKSNIHIGSTFGFCGFRMKKLYVDTYFDDNIYKNFIGQYLVVTESEDTVSLSQILTIFNKYLKDNNIDSKLIKQNKYFKTSFREELLKIIETFIGVKAIKRTNNSKRNGYSFFTGIKLIIK